VGGGEDMSGAERDREARVVGVSAGVALTFGVRRADTLLRSVC
jgi:hypothetical protein